MSKRRQHPHQQVVYSFEAQFHTVPPSSSPSLSAYQRDAPFASGMRTLREDLQGCVRTWYTSQQTVHPSLVSGAPLASWAPYCSEKRSCATSLTHYHFRVWHPKLPTLGIPPDALAHYVFLPLSSWARCSICQLSLLRIPLRRDEVLCQPVVAKKERYS